MRIVIDLQGVQAKGFIEDVGRYTLEFVLALIRNRSGHEIIVVLNDQYPEAIEVVRSNFKGVIPAENVQLYCLPEKIDVDGAAYKDIVDIAYLGFLSGLKPDIVHFTCLDKAVGIFNKVKQYKSFKISAFQYRKEIETITSCEHGCDVDCMIVLQQDIDTIDSILPVAIKAISDWELLDKSDSDSTLEISNKKLRLANISPLPPERSGIADYSAELLPFLANFYDIDVVTDQGFVDSEWIRENCEILTTAEFADSAEDYDRIIYHFGNNPMHVKMFELLKQFPGVVVLHDFFLSGIQWYREAHGYVSNSLWNELYLAHGYKAVRERFIEHDEAVVFRYPCNFSVLQNALSIIVHSENSLRLANSWYGLKDGMSVIPLLRHKAEPVDREYARKQLGISQDDYLVCSFGFIGKTKQNHRLLSAWEASPVLSGDKRCKLVYVGDFDDSPYAHELNERICQYRKPGIVKISGWTDTETYRLYLAAADAAVQLRTLSRGETSAAVLDCMNYGIATVINANGSMADIPEYLVRKIPDEFQDAELTAELESLRKNPEERKVLGDKAQHFLHTIHAPEHCASEYKKSIELAYRRGALSEKVLLDSLADVIPSNTSDLFLKSLASALSLNSPGLKPSHTVFLDVSVVARDDFKTGIQRVVRALTLALIEAPPKRFRIEPVFLSEDDGVWNYRYARDYTLALLDAPVGWIGNELIEAQSGDILLGLDLAGGYVIQADRQGVYQKLRDRGIQVSFVVYDLIPVQFDNIYPQGFKEGHADWLRVVAKSDSAICISKAVADELEEWVVKNVPDRAKLLDIKWFHLGADIETSCPSTGLPENSGEILAEIKRSPSFLMVGTLEPRKGHAQTLDAFELLWAQGVDVNLVVVGKEGWMVEELACRFRQHNELGKRLFWLEAISDEYLLKVYESSTCLLAASLGEGFGLPLIEAAQHKIPIIARDIPVFREVAGKHAFYFDSMKPEGLAEQIQQWLELYRLGKHPRSDNMPWLTWKESAKNLMDIVLGRNS